MHYVFETRTVRFHSEILHPIVRIHATKRSTIYTESTTYHIALAAKPIDINVSAVCESVCNVQMSTLNTYASMLNARCVCVEYIASAFVGLPTST